ncbi:hypothetical protein G6704_02800 [Polynucleobacter paneuropaeus]|nr:hypothetical protein G6704_02800 [Polynucleobacter paneuropaeus]
MKIKHLSGNHAEILFADETHVLFSYGTPVACLIGGEYFKTSKNWSQTTHRHINSWAQVATEKPQEYFNNLVEGI